MSRGPIAALAIGLGLLAAPALAAAQTVTGWGQLDWLRAQDSEDQLDDGSGAPLNRDRFVIPRARVALTAATAELDYVAELDGNTTAGARLGARRLEAGVRAATPAAWLGAPLVLRLGAGLFAAPFGHEVGEARDQDRLFAERALFADALFPGQLDLGVRASATLEAIALTVAVQNGEPLGAAGFPAGDPNAAKDWFVRAAGGWSLGPVRLDGGVSVTRGTGFHPGAPPGKDTLVWRDLNEDGIAQTSELAVIPGTAGVPSQNFARWGLGADLRARVAIPRLGATMLEIEGALASNLDRAVRPADPIALGRDQRTRGGSLALVQELGDRALVGARLDYYRPELDATDLQGGTLVRARQRFLTVTAAAAWRFVLGRAPARVTLDYRHQDDPLARDADGRPTDQANDALTLRLQVEVGR